LEGRISITSIEQRKQAQGGVMGSFGVGEKKIVFLEKE